MSNMFISKKKQVEKDASGTHRTISRKSTPNEISLQKVLQTPECLDEAAMTINFMTRRLVGDMFDASFFKDLLKNKIEMKLKELAVSYLKYFFPILILIKI